MIRAVGAQLRVRQWTKNLILFAGVIFSHHFTQGHEVFRAFEGFVAFCALASSIYTFNDIADVAADRNHPRKRFRPIASGQLPLRMAWTVALLLAVIAAILMIPLGWGFVSIAALYFLLNLAYSLVLKKVALVDVMMIGLGFVLRAVAGVRLLGHGVEVSPWLLVCTFFLALFLAVVKRRQERVLLAADAQNHRPILSEYPAELVDQLIPVLTASTVIAYTIYTVSPTTTVKLGSDHLVYTVPFVIYGVFRYLYLVYCRRLGDSPSDVFLSDPPMLINVILWIGSVVAILSTSNGH